MDTIVNVTGGKGGNAFLLLGDEKTALIDCGMAYCAAQLINNIKQYLNNRTLDYILISHSHYDHLGAVPFLKQVWPDSQVCGAEYAERILKRENALATIRKLSEQAAGLFHAGELAWYDDALMKVDTIIGDGDIIELGGLPVKVLATPGHTRCSLSFLVNNETLFLSESTGYMSASGNLYPGFITSCADTLASIEKCRKVKPRFIISPHYGVVNDSDAAGYWQNCITAVRETKEFILRLAEQGYEEEQILHRYEQEFRDEQSRQEQPLTAFMLNAQNMIKTVLREKA